MKAKSPPTLAVFLDRLQLELHQAQYLNSDPLEYVHRYCDPWDQEAVALLAAVLAYGNVKQIRRSVENVLARVHESFASPAEFVRALEEPRSPRYLKASCALRGFIHRFNQGEDLVLLFELLGESWRKHGSLGAHFLRAHDPAAIDFGPALNALMADWRKSADVLRAGQLPESFFYLLTAPKDGSCCKRWCMFLRWMGRKDELDPGLWMSTSTLAHTFPAGRELRADQLVIPLDTHTGRISQYLGLTRRKSLNWLAATEVTARLRACNADDPVRYDFALARLGILDLCRKKYHAETCAKCQLLPVCELAKRKAPRKKKSLVGSRRAEGSRRE